MRRAVGYFLLACTLAQCAAFGRRASVITTGVASRLSPDDVRIETKRSFLDAYKDKHAGPKKGQGAYYGRKWEAKRASTRPRREDAKRLSRAALHLRPDEPKGNGLTGHWQLTENSVR